MIFRNDPAWNDSSDGTLGNPPLPVRDTRAIVQTDSLVSLSGIDCAARVVDRVFEKMEALYGARFERQWRGAGLERTHRLWQQELAKLSEEQLARGLAALVAVMEPPTLPHFIRLCKPTIAPMAAYLEAVAGIAARERGETGEWSDPAVYRAAVAIGAFDLKTNSYARIRRRWEAVLAAELASPRGGAIPPPASFHTERSGAPQPGRANRERVAELRAAVINATCNTRDHKRWAKRIAQRMAAGDETVTSCQARAAKDALD